MTTGTSGTTLWKALRVLAFLSVVLSMFAPFASVAPAYASSVSSAAFSGGAGTVSVGGTLYAKSGGALTLTVNTSGDTKCVAVSGGHSAMQTSTTAKSTWTFTFTAGNGDGVQAVTAAASPNFNANNCTGQTGSAQASYTRDNTGPVVTAALSPAANAAGWNNSNVSITWSATDAGSGVASGPTPATDSQQQNTAGTPKTATATDRLGNVGNGSVTVKLDKNAPTITGSRSPAANANGWNNSDVTVSFTCSDGLSGIKFCSPSTTLSSNGAGQSITGIAVDNADLASVPSTVGSINIDKTAPTLSGAPTTSPNPAGWYNGNVAIRWTASDALSGLAGSAPADGTISSEGSGLTASASVSDRAGNTTNAISSPAVKIDKTAPNTTATAPTNWNNTNVTVSLNASDALSLVKTTHFKLDGGAQQDGTSVAISAEGIHTLQFWSEDNAGNVETIKSVQVKIDRTPPTINHSQSPAANVNGWNNSNVTVHFICGDALSGIASCTADQIVSSEGPNQAVTGTAVDNAGNTATDPATVSIDKTPPTISAAADRSANANGWYDDDVIVSFTCGDALSGIDDCSTARTLGEGANQGASGAAKDAAGNSASAGITGIDVDKTAPSLSGTASPAANANGWRSADVTVTWSCSDALSGLDGSCPTPSTIAGEGDNLSASASIGDLAGNMTSRTVDGIKIDRSAPSTSASVPAPLQSGWYKGAVQVTLNGVDSLSGVDATYYSVDGGAAQTYNGAFSFGAKGQHTIAFWSVDNAGNVETAGAPIALKIDGIAPTTTVVNPISPDSGWFVTSGIPVAFDANDAESGIEATYYQIDGGAEQTYGEPFTADLSTGSHTITYWSVDLAGNAEAKQTTQVKVDTVPPTITGAASPAPNGFGWNNANVNVTFTCTDADSGINGVAGCAGDTTLTNDGAGQSVHGDAVDVAGNRSSIDFGPVHIDLTKPTLTGVPTADANAAGWYKTNVTIRWTGDDGLSGIDPATQPADSTIAGEGANLGAGPVTIKDKAGNVSDPASVTGIKIDRTAPVIAGGPTTGPNAAGWYKDEVVVDFACTDNLSGVAFCPTSKLIKGDGANQSVTSDPAVDLAGNASAGKTVGSINIDGTPPATTSNNQCTATNGYCTGSTANVVLTATDQTGLSGVKEIRYSIDGGPEQVAAGATKTVSVPLTGSGAGTVRYYAVDNAGNVETANNVALKWDNIAPAVSHSLSPKPNADEWNNSNVTVTFTARDDDAGSGVASVSPPVTVSAETTGQVVNGQAIDTAGNVGTDSVTVKLDKTAPSITGAVVSGVRGNNGWYIGPVTVHFTCADALSGIATCPDDVTLTQNGANTASGTATDKAGNSASASVPGINIDQEKPTITTADVNVAGGTYTLGAVPAATCTAADSFSGLASCTVAVNGGNANGVGTFTYSATATDRAGNTSTANGTFKVIYRFDGFLQPINNTAHQVGATTSIFKAGSTVPAKFQLKKADGSIVLNASIAAWLTPVKGSATSAPVDETVYAASADSGSAYRYDASAQQYIYNWKTGTGGNYWRIGVKLDDGQTYYVNIGLR